MAKATRAYSDATGSLHLNPEAATLSDIVTLLGGAGGGVAAGMAQTILAKRVELEAIFREHDAMTGADQ